MQPHRDRYIREPVWILGNRQTQTPIPHRVVLATTRTFCTHRISARVVPTHGMKAVPGSVDARVFDSSHAPILPY